MLFAAWSLKTLFEMAWTIAPTSFLGSTFGITNNDNTKDARKEESRRGWGDIEHNTRQSEIRYLGAPSFLPHFCMTEKDLDDK